MVRAPSSMTASAVRRLCRICRQQLASQAVARHAVKERLESHVSEHFNWSNAQQATWPARSPAARTDRPHSIEYPQSPWPEEPQPRGFWSKQEVVFEAYQSTRVQIGVAVLIVSNFLMNILQAQIGTNGRHRRFFQSMEEFYFTVFWAELLVNAYSSWFYRFWRDAWNVFDFTVVIAATADLIIQVNTTLDPSSGLRLLRMMRAFRVFRLFKRVKSLRKILISLVRALPGMLNALLILLLNMCIYAILGYQFFHDYPCGSPEKGGPQTCDIDDLIDDNSYPPSGRRICSKRHSPGYGVVTECRADTKFGHEYFGNFFKSMYTLFQVLTGESWSEVIGRALLEQSPFSAIYFVSFILLNSVVMINVVVAVLLEKMVVNDDDDENDDDDDDRAGSDNVEVRCEDASNDGDCSPVSPAWDSDKAQDQETLRHDLKAALGRIDGLQRQLDDMHSVLHLLAAPTEEVLAEEDAPADVVVPDEVLIERLTPSKDDVITDPSSTPAKRESWFSCT